MVQQNLVQYILRQVKQGKKLEDVNAFLVNAGYDKDEVESSVQYVINLEQAPQIAEQQRIQQLAGYIQQQVGKGYDQGVIANFLISKGYPYYEVNSAINILKAPKQEVRIEHKLAYVALVTIIMISVGIGIVYFSALQEPASPAKLLDVTTNKLTTLTKPGADLSFQLNVVNLGEVKRYDITVNYEIIHKETGKVIAEQHETFAISTSTQRVVTIPIPQTALPGKYTLKATAVYEDFNATSGFLFEILPESAVAGIVEEVEKMLPQNLTNITTPEIVVPEVPTPEQPPAETEVPTEPGVQPGPTQEVTIPKTEEDIFLAKSKAEAIEFVKAVSVRDAPKAISLCRLFSYESQQRECIKELALFKQSSSFCVNIEDDIPRDSCYMQVIMETKEVNQCSNIKDANIRNSCEMYGSLLEGAKKYSGPNTMPEITIEIPEVPSSP